MRCAWWAFAALLAALACASASSSDPSGGATLSFEEKFEEERARFALLEPSLDAGAGEGLAEEDAKRVARFGEVRRMQARVRGAWKAFSRREEPLSPEEKELHRELFRATMSLGRLDAEGVEWLAGSRGAAAAADAFLEARDYFAMGERAFDEERWEDASRFLASFARRADDEGRGFSRRFHRVHANVLPYFLFSQMARYRAGRPALAAEAADLYLAAAESGRFPEQLRGEEEGEEEEGDGGGRAAETEMVRGNLAVFREAAAEREPDEAVAAERRANLRFVRTMLDASTEYAEVQGLTEQLEVCASDLEIAMGAHAAGAAGEAARDEL